MTSAIPTTDLIADRYRLERLVGHGGMADVYRAVDETGGPPVAVKVVRSTDPELARRLTREARAVEGLDHPALVRLLGAGLHDDHAYLVMELVEGPTLAEQLQHGPLAPDRCAAIGTSLAEALAYVHAHGIVHRDVKPANVLLGPAARVRLSDFGVAQVLDASAATITGTTLGTAAYMAPEQLAHHRVGAAADVWALGSVLLECLTGRRAFEGAPAEVVARRLAGATPSPEGLPVPWRMVLGSMLDTEPARRPEAREVAELLKAPAFTRPWDPRPTELVPPVAGGTVTSPGTAAADATAIVPGVEGEPTLTVRPPTDVAPAVSTLASTPRRRARRLAVVSALVALVLLGALVSWALSSAPAKPPKAANRPTTSTTATTSTTSTTTTTQLTGADAAGALVRDVQQGEQSGALSSSDGKNILDQLGQALSASARGDSAGTETALGNIEQTVSDASANGDATSAEASTLLSDVGALATALGVQNPSATTTTAPGPGGGGPGGGGSGGGGPGGGH